MAKRNTIVKFDEQGESGVQIFSGQIMGEEYNRNLVGIKGTKVYDEMRRSDATVRQALWAVKYPIIKADWFVTAASEDAKDKEIAAFVTANLMEILKWRHMVEEALTCTDFGWSLFEMADFEPRMVDGTLRVVLTKFAFRKQTTLYKWERDDGKPGITQWTVTGPKSIDEVKLARFTLQQEGDNYEGVSMLRSAYKHWFYKDKFYKMEAIGYERQAVGVPYASYPPGATKEQKAEVKKLLRNMRANQEAYMMYPQGWEAGFMDMGAGSSKDVKPGIDHHDLQILKAVFAQFMSLGATQSGSRAVSSDHSSFFMLGVEAVADLITEVFNDVVVKTLVDLNFTTDRYPTLGHGDLADDNMAALSEAVSKFVTAGALNARPEDENMVRKMIGWPELSEEEIKERKKQAEEARKLKQTETEPAAGKSTSKDKKTGKADDEGDLNAAVLAEARRTAARLSKVLYGKQSRAA